MKILFEHQGILPVQKYGGTERIIYWHIKELCKLGHEVTVMTHPKSYFPKELKVNHLISPSLSGSPFNAQIPKDIDVVHLFYTPNFKVDRPLLVTIEGNGRPLETFHPNTVFISKKHAENHQGNIFVYNGIDLSEYPFHRREKRSLERWEHFLFLAKASWKVKNLSDCLKATKETKKHLHLAGGRKWSLRSRLHSYGMVDQQKKIELLSKVDALLFPVRWHEPFGIAIIEAMAMGIPVIGSPFGSLSEIISHGETGFIVSSFEELVEAIKSKPPFPFDPERIRHFTEDKFSISKMSANYLELYNKICKGEVLNATPPKTLSNESPEKLLPF